MRTRKPVRELTVIGMMTAVLCILAPFSLMLPGMVPISLATLALYFFPYILGGKGSALCCLIYIIIGAAGLPVFSGFSGGISRLAGPTGGYIIGYFAIILIESAAIRRFPDKKSAHIIGMVSGTALCYLLGTAWYCFLTKITLSAALTVAVLPFIPADAAKIAAASALAPIVSSRLQKAGCLPTVRF